MGRCKSDEVRRTEGVLRMDLRRVSAFPTVWVEKRETKDYVIGAVEEGSCMAEIRLCDLWVLSRADEALTAEGLKMM